jgi:uncharacterized protein
MKCPVDDTDLVMSDRQGIEIDYCPKCRGVWLDRGELDKIIERSDAGGRTDAGPARYAEENRGDRYPERPRERHDDDDDSEYEGHRREYRSESGYHDGGHHKKHKKEGFMSDLFDF